MNVVRLVVMRHGQSVANVEQRFAGSIDVALTDLGKEQARNAGLRLRESGIAFDQVLTSALSRARTTAMLTMDALGASCDVRVDARLNERRFGTLEGIKFADAAAEFGAEWGEPWLWGKRPPEGESMEDLAERLAPLLESELKPAIADGLRWMLVAHGNTISVLDDMLSNGGFPRLDRVPPATPLIYELDRTSHVVVSRTLLII
jgi:2,3-bisphosphoglycerate-dependent phosphoglycerate mutase